MSKAPLRSWGPSSKQVAPVPARHCWLPGDTRERESVTGVHADGGQGQGVRKASP